MLNEYMKNVEQVFEMLNKYLKNVDQTFEKMWNMYREHVSHV